MVCIFLELKSILLTGNNSIVLLPGESVIAKIHCRAVAGMHCQEDETQSLLFFACLVWSGWRGHSWLASFNRNWMMDLDDVVGWIQLEIVSKREVHFENRWKKEEEKEKNRKWWKLNEIIYLKAARNWSDVSNFVKLDSLSRSDMYSILRFYMRTHRNSLVHERTAQK